MVNNKHKPLLPKNIRDELRMTVALQGCSLLIQCKDRTMKSRHDQMFTLYHGQTPNLPSQIKMLCDGAGSYRDVYDSTQIVVSRKAPEASSTSILILKPTLGLDSNKHYLSGKKILLSYLERNAANNPLLVTGRSLYIITKRE